MFKIFKRNEKSKSIESKATEPKMESMRSLFIKKTPAEVIEMIGDEMEDIRKSQEQETNDYQRKYNEGYLEGLLKAATYINFID